MLTKVKRITCALVLVPVMGLSTRVVLADDSEVEIVGMTGDKNAVWIATSNRKLVYCWWPQDPSRLDRQAQCRVLDRFGVDRLQ